MASDNDEESCGSKSAGLSEVWDDSDLEDGIDLLRSRGRGCQEDDSSGDEAELQCASDPYDSQEGTVSVVDCELPMDTEGGTVNDCGLHSPQSVTSELVADEGCQKLDSSDCELHAEPGADSPEPMPSITEQWIPQQDLHAQAQALITQATLSARRLPVQLIKGMLDALGIHGVVRNFAEHAVAALIGIGKSTVRRCYDKWRGNGWQPYVPNVRGRKAGGPADPVVARRRKRKPQPTSDIQVAAMQVRVRECLAIASWGEADIEYERRLHRHSQNLNAPQCLSHRDAVDCSTDPSHSPLLPTGPLSHTHSGFLCCRPGLC
jgi:transposase